MFHKVWRNPHSLAKFQIWWEPVMFWAAVSRESSFLQIINVRSFWKESNYAKHVFNNTLLNCGNSWLFSWQTALMHLRQTVLGSFDWLLQTIRTQPSLFSNVLKYLQTYPLRVDLSFFLYGNTATSILFSITLIPASKKQIMKGNWDINETHQCTDVQTTKIKKN